MTAEPPIRWPGYPNLTAQPVSWSDRRHIVYGDEDDEESGGHLHGLGRPGKTEFPPGWDEDDCIDVVIAVARNPQDAVDRGDSWRVTGTHRGVVVRAFVRYDGTIAAGHPTSGPGVRANPRRNR